MSDITYLFECGESESYSYSVTLGQPALPPADSTPAEWTKLEFHQCDGCQWKNSDRCPVALSLQEPVNLLNKLNSFEQIKVTVTAPDRTYSKDCSVQEGLGALFGLVMAQSGCPAFKYFQGLAWFHLPFANCDETLFRVTSSYLLQEFLREGASKSKAEIITDIKAIYDMVGKVNRFIVKRLREGVAPTCDSPYNAIILLDSMGSMVAFSVENALDDLRGKFL